MKRGTIVYVKEQFGCMELLYRTNNSLVESLWDGTRREDSECDMVGACHRPR